MRVRIAEQGDTVACNGDRGVWGGAWGRCREGGWEMASY
jgi:hypothetical protein